MNESLCASECFTRPKRSTDRPMSAMVAFSEIHPCFMHVWIVLEQSRLGNQPIRKQLRASNLGEVLLAIIAT